MPEESLEKWLQRIEARSRQADIMEAANELAKRLYLHTATVNARTWREAAHRSMHGKRLYDLLQSELQQGPTGAYVTQLVRENARLISSLPAVSARQVTDEIAKAAQSGARPATMAKMMAARFPKLLRSRVKLIARTETAKASTALTEARCTYLAIPFYIWEGSMDQRVRTSHRKMQGIIIPWAHPPSPEALVGEKSTLGNYHAGSAPNCRCYPAALLDPSDVQWPHSVFWNGSIQRMSLAQFRQIAA
jgi:SPP1 gp7 family putative phage head morphogenesis protein